MPTSAYAHHWIAVCHAAAAAIRDAALREAEATLAIDPRFTDARVLRGGSAGRARRLRARDRGAAAAPSTPTRPSRCCGSTSRSVLAEAGRAGEAAGEYAVVLAAHPDDPGALTGMGALEASSGNLDAAARDLRRALELQPGLDEARINLALVLERQGRATEALAEYRRLADAPTTTAQIRARARQRLQHAR